MKKKLFSALLALTLMLSMTVPALAYNYEFSTGADNTFGTATSYDEPVSPDPMSENTRRNKDAASLPPPYFYGSGDIPTDPSSLYHDNLQNSGFVHQNQDLPKNGGEDYAPGISTVTGGLLPSTSQSTAQITAPKHFEDGSIGTLTIPKLSKTIKVYQGESLDNMKKGIGHFESTSAWDGNVALAGHNRGAAAYFSFVKNLAVGDKLTYTTPYGTRTYEVTSKIKISETDYSGLGWSAENLLTLITCVENEPAYRWQVTAREVK